MDLRHSSQALRVASFEDIFEDSGMAYDLTSTCLPLHCH